MASELQNILGKLRSKKELTDKELKDLQLFVDRLETRAAASASHHDTTSHHHTSAFAAIAEEEEE